MFRIKYFIAIVCLVFFEFGFSGISLSKDYSFVKSMNEPKLITDTIQTGKLKQGKGSAMTVLKFYPILSEICLFSMGDLSIASAMKDGNISKIHHIDEKIFGLTFICTWFEAKTITVFGY